MWKKTRFLQTGIPNDPHLKKTSGFYEKLSDHGISDGWAAPENPEEDGSRKASRAEAEQPTVRQKRKTRIADTSSETKVAG
jgi:hypothetical protein